MKLEIKHLAPYLPYSLQTAYKNSNNKWKVNELTTQNLVSILISDVDKPVLRPLSCLIEEIEVDSKKFIPLKKIHELDETNSFDKTNNFYKIKFVDKVISIKNNKYPSLEREDFCLKYLVETTNIGDYIYSFTYNPELRRFGKRNDTSKAVLGIGFQLDMFNKLFEWHIDVFDLIPKGLAIDINTISDLC